jgi:D-inositol-3-phosphate glycosyltransferase
VTRAVSRILFASHYALPHLGGIEVAIDALARRLSARGHEVVHVASAAGGAGEAPYRVLRTPALNAPEERLGVPWPVFGPQIVPVLRREVARADVVHAHGLLYGSSFLALMLHGRRRVVTEHVGHVHYENPALDRVQRAAIAIVGRAAVRRSQAVVVLNDKVRAEMAALGARRIETIPNGVDTDAYRPPGPGERERLRAELGWDDTPRALFVGRLVAKKGIDLALAAARPPASWRLVVVGPGRAPRESGDATLLGPLPRERVAQLYRAADALLLPSRGEGFPLTAQEAMASGLPVVLGDDPAYAPYLAGAGAGVRTAPPDPVAIGAAVLAAFGGGADALAHARRAFSWERAADAHEALYASL